MCRRKPRTADTARRCTVNREKKDAASVTGTNVTLNTDKTQSKTAFAYKRLKEAIVSGEYGPGARLPTYDELTESLGVSRTSVQQAVKNLCMDGFIRSVDRRGLFVSDFPPHTSNIGLLFGLSPGDNAWSKINGLLMNEAENFSKSKTGEPFRFRIYSGLTGHEDSHAETQRLLDDISGHRLAGLAYLPGAAPLHWLIRKNFDWIPEVFICAHASSGLSPSVNLDSGLLYRRAMERLVHKGCRRIAMIHMCGTAFDVKHKDLYEEFGLSFRIPWIQWIGRSNPETSRGLARLLMDNAADKRPDGLIIADDNLIEHVSAGILDCGIVPGRDLHIAAHGNWPWKMSKVPEMDRIGFSVREILRACVSALCGSGGKSRPDNPQKMIHPLFEEEFLLNPECENMSIPAFQTPGIWPEHEEPDGPAPQQIWLRETPLQQEHME